MAPPVVDFGNLQSSDGLGKLDKHLKDSSYISGHNATQDDVEILNQLIKLPTEYPSVMRWLHHILYFSEEEKRIWPKGQGVVGKKASPAPKKVDDDDNFDPFAEDTEEDKEAKKALQQKVKDAKPKKKVVNKSTLVIDVKPVNTEVDLDKTEKLIREISLEGLEWSKASKKLPVAFGLFKLQIGCTIVDDLINTDAIVDRVECVGLNEEDSKKKIALRDGEVEEDEDEDAEDLGLVQSAEIVSFNKL